MVFIEVMRGLDVQFQNFRIEGGNVRDRMNSLELCRKLIFGSLDWRVATWSSGSRMSQGGLVGRAQCVRARHDMCDWGAWASDCALGTTGLSRQRYNLKKKIKNNDFYFSCVFGTLRLDDASLN